ncbi:MAG: PilT protein domain protein [Bryobacterales bacterium]|nr:PilT protein domain protein [Bryobacterales bacterium]
MLDTNIATDVIKGRSPEVADRLSSLDPGGVCVSAITRAELMYGLIRLPRGHKLHLGVRQFLKTLNVVPWDADASDFYAEIRHQATTDKQPVGEMDMMIAAHSLSLAAILVTNNSRHYSGIVAPLILETWVSAETD